MNDNLIKILLIEDNPGDVRLIRELLAEVTDTSFHIAWADRLSSGLDRLAQGEGVDVVLLDLGLPDSQGLDTFARLHARAPHLPVVILSGLSDEVLAAKAVRNGTQDYLVKGRIDGNLLRRSLRYAIERQQRQQAEEALMESNAKYKELAASITDVFFAMNDQLRYTYWNRASEELMGVPAKEALGKHLYDLFPDNEMTRRAEGLYLKAIRTKQPQFFTNEYQLGGKDFVFEISAYPSEDGVAVFAKDITERERMEQEVIQQNQELIALHRALTSITQTLDLGQVLQEIVRQAGAAIASSYTSIVLVNPDGTLGMGAEDFAGMPPISVRAREAGVTRGIIQSGQTVVIDDAEADKRTNPALLAVGVKSYAGVPLKVKDSTVGVLFVYSRQRDAFRGRERVLADFASQAAIAIENARLYQEASTVGALREADRLKDELLANVSHELRTPLASIKGYSSLLLHYDQGIERAERLEHLQAIVEAADRLTEMVEHLLDMSRLRSGMLTIDRQPADIAELIGGALQEAEIRAPAHRFISKVLVGLPEATIDAGRIHQVLDNLLNNAIKFSPEGTEITVRCEAGAQELVVSVQDQGAGIAPEDCKRLFERFYQAPSTWGLKSAGAGLGLAICKRIVELHGGRIWVESQPGKGSTFFFTLPLEATSLP